jgi:5-formyltetrahydrofolate cyclo-ligase
MMALLPATCGDVVAMFASTAAELNTDGLAATLRQRGIDGALPVVDGDALRFHRVPPAGWASLRVSRFGIREPLSSWPVVSLQDCAWVIVPGVAMGIDGSRLGRGRGYYDRCLEAVPQALRCGWLSDDRLVHSVPADNHDVRMGWVVTPQRVVRCP